jgi:putative membrane protein
MNAGSSASATAKLSMADQKFIKEAAQGGIAEVELGQLAVLKASSDDVKKFGQRMVDDHTKANSKLKELAGTKGIQLPQSPDAKQEATKDRLSKLSAEEFDKVYMTDMLKDHKKDVAAFRAESNTGHDPDVKNFAAQMLPTLRDHLKDAQGIAPKAIQAKTTVVPNASQR